MKTKKTHIYAGLFRREVRKVAFPRRKCGEARNRSYIYDV